MTDPNPLDRAQAHAALLPALREAIREAASLALPHFRPGGQTSARVWSKAGGSPVTEADVAVDAFLKVRLSAIEPRAAWLSEETVDDAQRLTSDLVWIVDPIDGTRAFLNGHPDWSISVALLDRGVPVLGFVHAPSLDRFYEAAHGAGAWLDGRRIGASDRDDLDGAGITGPKPLLERLERGAARAQPKNFTEPMRFTRIERVPSLALRVARVAEGAIDIGLVSKDSRDWDLAGADLILREAGGTVCDFDGTPTVYNRPEPRHGELLAVSRRLRDPALAALTAG